MLKAITTTALILALAGCGGFNKAGRQAAGMGVLTDTESAFDGKRLIELSPAPIGGTTGMFSSCCKAGLIWSPSIQDTVILRAEVGAIAALSKVALNLDGETIELDPVSRLTQFGSDRSSAKGFAVSIDVLRQISSSERARIMITTLSSGSVIGDLKTSDGGMFIDFLPEFLAAIEKAVEK